MMKRFISFILDQIVLFYYGVKSTLVAPVEPSSTRSNIAYIVGSLLVCIMYPTMWFYGTILALLGVGSAMYHGVKSKRWRNFDEIMMYFAFVTLINAILFLGGYISYDGFILMSIAFSLMFAFGYDYLDSFIVMPILFIVVVGLLIMVLNSLVFPIWMMAVFGMATFFNMIGREHKHKSFQFYEMTHSVWHLMTAYGLTHSIIEVIQYTNVI